MSGMEATVSELQKTHKRLRASSRSIGRWSLPGGEVAAVGLEFVVLDDRGRILTDYQFIVS